AAGRGGEGRRRVEVAGAQPRQVGHHLRGLREGEVAVELEAVGGERRRRRAEQLVPHLLEQRAGGRRPRVAGTFVGHTARRYALSRHRTVPAPGVLSGGEQSAEGLRAGTLRAAMRAWSRGLLACGLLAALSACGDAPLIKLTLHYSGFEPACVQVQASDGADPDLPAPQPVPVPPGTRNGDLTVSIWGKPGWSDQVRLATEAHEKTCDGPKVAGEVRMVTVTRGQTFSLELFLEATDADQDGFVAAPAGTDCDDAQASIHPGATEICNNQDDNCANG